MKRECSDCTLCCKLVPVSEGVMVNGVPSPTSLHKKAGERCPHQRHTGCAIYERRPFACRRWSCMWLQGAPTRRPDRCHYVIDMMPDFVTLKGDEAGEGRNVAVFQVWCDPKYPDAHRDPELREFLNTQRMGALVRFNNTAGRVIFPPSLTGEGWHETDTSWSASAPEHTIEEINEVLRGGGL